MNYVKLLVNDGDYVYEFRELDIDEVREIAELELDEYEEKLIERLFEKNKAFIEQLTEILNTENDKCKIVCFKKTTALKLARIFEVYCD